MKIAINHRENSYSSYWIDYCKKNNLKFKVVNCYDNNIINEIEDCDIFLYDWTFWHETDKLIAKNLIYSAELLGKITYPNNHTCQYFDDKIGQKYLLESLKLPLVPSYVFFDRKKALKWLKETKYPVVFKLRGGAGASNVKLIKTFSKAKRLVKIAFKRGFKAKNKIEQLKSTLSSFHRNKTKESSIEVLKSLYRMFVPNQHNRSRPKERSYLYFQKFIPNCNFDIRIVVIGNRAFAIKRFVRKNDFRASGSGVFEFDPNSIPLTYIKHAFEANEKLKMQSVAFDFIESEEGPKIIEISHRWAINSFGKHPGYWDNNLNWHEGNFYPTDFILEDLIENYKTKK